MPATTPTPAVEFDGGDMDCGSGLLLAITTRMRAIGKGKVMLLHTRERSLLADLAAWAKIAGLDSSEPTPPAWNAVRTEAHWETSAR